MSPRHSWRVRHKVTTGSAGVAPVSCPISRTRGCGRDEKEDSMSLSVPAAPVGDDWALSGEEDFVCDASESPIAAIEKCLDNGLGACLVVDGRRYLGRVSLDELGRAALDGALLAPTVGQHLRAFPSRLSNAAPAAG